MPYVYQAPGCAENRYHNDRPQCEDPRCVVCYAEKATSYEECGDHWGDSLEIVRCSLPKGHRDTPENWHSTDVTWGMIP